MAKQADVRKLEALERVADPADPNQQELLGEMRATLKKMQESSAGRYEDPRLSFSTPEFKEAQRTFTENFKKNFGRPVEWGLVQEYPWSVPVLRRINPAEDNSKQ